MNILGLINQLIGIKTLRLTVTLIVVKNIVKFVMSLDLFGSKILGQLLLNPQT